MIFIIKITITTRIKAMKKKQITILSFLLLLFSSIAYSQENKSLKKLFPVDWYTLDRNQIQFNQPKEFTLEIDTLQKENAIRLRCIVSEKFHGLLTVYYNHLISRDKNFIVYISVPPVFCRKEDSTYIDTGLMPELKHKINNSHLIYIKGDFWGNIGGERITSLQNLPLNYRSSKYARKTFNADTVITYPLKMWQKLENKYNHCQVVMIQKNTRGFIFLYCFYNDRAIKRLKYYFKSLEKVFWYRNPKDYIEVIEPKIDSIYVVPHLKNN